MDSFFRFAAAVFILLAPRAVAQEESKTPPCSAPEFRQLDFWVGTWNLTWTTKEGQAAQGKNVISHELDNCVIQEHFSGPGRDRPYRGMSVSTYDAKAGTWRQTWVSNTGGYLPFKGGQSDEGFQLRLVESADGRNLRMIWKNVKEDNLDWHWQESKDGGKTWADLWIIHYNRAN